MKTHTLAKITGITALIITSAITATIVFISCYYYHHQSRIKDYLSLYLSQTTKASVIIKKFSFSISPMTIEIEGLSVLPGKDQKGFRFDFPDIKADLCIKGNLGQRELRIKSVHVDGFGIKLSSDMHLPTIPKQHTSHIPDFIQDILSYLFFEKITVARIEVNNGLATIKNNSGTIKAYNINTVLNDKRVIDATCRLNTSLKTEKGSLNAGGKVDFRIFFKKDTTQKKHTCNIDLSTDEMQCLLSKNGKIFKGNITGTTALELIYPHLKIKRTSFDIRKAAIDSGGKAVTIGKVHLGLHSATLNMSKKTFQCHNIQIDSDILKNLNLAIDSSTKRTVLKIHGRRINLIKTAEAIDLIPPFWTAGGNESVNIRCIINNTPVWHFVCSLDLDNAFFSNQDESIAGDGLQSNIRFKGNLDTDRLLIGSSVQIDIPKGEILYDPFYLDLASNSLHAKGYISADLSKKRISVSKLNLGIEDIIETKGRLSLSNKTASLYINLPFTPMTPLFKVAVFDPFGDMIPVINKINLAGLVSGTFSVKKHGQSISIKGRILLDNGKLVFKDRHLSLQHVKLNLPVFLHYPLKKNAENISKEQKGDISFEVAFPPWLPRQHISIPIHSRPNSLSVHTPTRIKVPGGDITIKRLIISDIKPASVPKIQAGISIAIKDTRPLFKDILHMPVRGDIEGNIDPIYIKNGAGKGLGKIIARIFDGQIIISDIHIRNIFRGLPFLALKADIKNLNLKKMTKGTSFGEIDGILDGYINGLEIACGQVQAFELMLETKEVDSIPQRISIAAVDNIAHIGGGQSPFMGLAGIIAKGFKTLPYSKIGIKASLKNDVFRINGTIKENNVEYIIKRGSFFGVNIVNQNPDNRISFKDMLRRIKRIFAAKK